jgi:serine/threonine protein kinase
MTKFNLAVLVAFLIAVAGSGHLLQRLRHPARRLRRDRHHLERSVGLHRRGNQPVSDHAGLDEPCSILLLQVLEGLGYAHAQGIIHRDVKPTNILVTSSRQAEIADFGIARLADANATLGGVMLGTPSYIAPE